jgi:hypothetical protein
MKGVRVPFFALVLSLAGCGLIDSVADGKYYSLGVRLNLPSDSVAPGDTTRAELEVLYDGVKPMTLQGTSACLMELEVLRDGAAQAFPVLPDRCRSADQPLRLVPGDTARQEWRIVLQKADGTPAPLGSYQITVRVNATTDRGSKIKDASAAIVVR